MKFFILKFFLISKENNVLPNKNLKQINLFNLKSLTINKLHKKKQNLINLRQMLNSLLEKKNNKILFLLTFPSKIKI